MEVKVQVPKGPGRISVVGAAERNLKIIREALGVNITARDGDVHLKGDTRAVSVARSVLRRLGVAAERDESMSREDVLNVIADETERYRISDGGGFADETAESPSWEGGLSVYAGGRPVRPRTPNQGLYLEAIRTHDLVFGIGPAGTGKTYLAVAAAIHLLRADRVKKVVLARPAVEAGEKLGFLPGDIEAKVNPYLRPLLDALNDMMDYGTIRRFMDTDVVEIVPLAFMRGRTLNNAVIILDEAQNTTKGQMQMFLTRMGQGSKMIVNGDATQIDLPDPRASGLIDAARRLRRVPGIAFTAFEKGDVVRHELVQRIVEAYGEEGPMANSTGPKGKSGDEEPGPAEETSG